ncbi:MAG: hypothetical protein ACXWT3_11805 [Methylococcaceae bacterium]
MSRKKPKLGYDQRGGVMAVSRAMRESAAYVSMPAKAKVLMDLLHLQWRNEKPVAYGVREASQKLKCNASTAGKAFKYCRSAVSLFATPSRSSTARRAARLGNGA